MRLLLSLQAATGRGQVPEPTSEGMSQVPPEGELRHQMSLVMSTSWGGSLSLCGITPEAEKVQV